MISEELKKKGSSDEDEAGGTAGNTVAANAEGRKKKVMSKSQTESIFSRKEKANSGEESILVRIE